MSVRVKPDPDKPVRVRPSSGGMGLVPTLRSFGVLEHLTGLSADKGGGYFAIKSQQGVWTSIASWLKFNTRGLVGHSLTLKTFYDFELLLLLEIDE